MEIRDLMPADAAAVHSMLQQLHHEHVLREPDRYVDVEVKEDNRDVFADLGMFNDGVLVGILLSDWRYREHRVQKVQVLVRDIYVDFRYRRQKVATRLMNELKSRVTGNAAGIRLCCVSGNMEALAFYKRCGLREIEKVLEMGV